MPDPSVIHSTFVIERTYPVSPGRVFAAFSNPAQKRRWFGESDTHDLELFELDFRPGGLERTRVRFNDRTPFPGTVFTTDSTYLDILPDRRLVIAQSMCMGEKRISASLDTFEFLLEGQGATLIFTNQIAFFEGADGPQMREAGWGKLLTKLGNSLTPE